MPGDPNECRQRALHYMEMARAGRTPEQKMRLTDLAQSWLNLATELERVQALLTPQDAANADEQSPKTTRDRVG
jgi:hypothetical protein